MGRELTLHEKIELGEEAKRLLAPGSMFNKIVTALLVEYTDVLIQAPVGDLTAHAAHASMKALNDIKGRMQIIANDATMAKDKAKKHGHE
jgi:hypothetical protein